MTVSSVKTGYDGISLLVGNAAYIPAVRGIFFGGVTTYPSATNTIDYVNILSAGNATDFGDLSVTRWGGGACSSSTRGILAGGQTGESGATISNVIDYVTIATTGNATDFGDLLERRYVINNGCSSSTRGLFFGGSEESTTYVNKIEYITIATTGNATDFGDTTYSAYGMGSLASPTRAVSAGGWTGSVRENTINYVTIASTGNATDFGDLSVGRYYASGASNSTRGLFSGGESASSVYSNVIDYITIATTGNATDFGDLTVARGASGGTSSSARAVFAGGSDAGSNYNVIDYVIIATTGNAVDFGDLTVTRHQLGACSDGHGGL